MRKYHLADALTALEIIMAATITGMIIFGGSADVVIWLFAVGELCDAFDGICARRWPYPDDGKFRWWRVPRTVQLIEHVSDIFLLVACAIFLVVRSSLIIRVLTVIGGTTIAAICFLIEVEIQTDDFYLLQPKRAEEVILWRRKVYLVGIALGVAFLIFSTSWNFWIKLGCCLIGIAIGLYLIKKKADRLNNR